MSQQVKISRAQIAKKLAPSAYGALQSAVGFARLRGNAVVEIAHWLFELYKIERSDLNLLLVALGMDPKGFEKALLRELDSYPRGATAVSDFSNLIDELLEGAYVLAAGYGNTSAARSGHVFVAMLRLQPALRALGGVGTFLRSTTADAAWLALGNLRDAPESQEVATSNAVASEAMQTASTGEEASALSRFTTDMTADAQAGKIDPVVGRDNEIRQLIDILMRRRQNNPILTGDPGVGKTAIVEGLARAVIADEVPPVLKGVQIRSLDIGALSAGASMKGEFESRLRGVIDGVQSSKIPIILFIDEAHTLIGAGGAAGTGDAANLLKPALARGTLRTIAATTWGEYKRYFEKDAALVRRFQVVQVAEPALPDAIRMLRTLKPEMEKHHKVEVLDEAVISAVNLSARYLPARQLPDKAISLMDTACARVAVGLHTAPDALIAARRKLETAELENSILLRKAALGEAVEAALAELQTQLADHKAELNELEQRSAQATALAISIIDSRSKLCAEDSPDVDKSELAEKLKQDQSALTSLQAPGYLLSPFVDASSIAAVVSDWTGIPLGRMLRNEHDTLGRLGALLGERVVGQEQAHQELAKRIRVAKAGLQDPAKPLGVFLLAGPSGVGKTETALALADYLYGGEHNLISINMSEFQEAHTVSTLKGSPPGYVGYGEGGRLTEAVRRKPYSVVLLDEVEKAHPDVHEIFFQVFDKGVMEDSEGRRIDFRNTLILLTTNVGSTELIEHVVAGKPHDSDALTDSIMEPLRDVFPDALLGRMKVVPFLPLSADALHKIVEINLRGIARRAKQQHALELTFTATLVEWVSSMAKPTVFGARLVQSVINAHVATVIADEILKPETMQPKMIVDFVEGKAVVGCA